MPTSLLHPIRESSSLTLGFKRAIPTRRCHSGSTRCNNRRSSAVRLYDLHWLKGDNMVELLSYILRICQSELFFWDSLNRQKKSKPSSVSPFEGSNFDETTAVNPGPGSTAEGADLTTKISFARRNPKVYWWLGGLDEAEVVGLVVAKDLILEAALLKAPCASDPTGVFVAAVRRLLRSYGPVLLLVDRWRLETAIFQRAIRLEVQVDLMEPPVIEQYCRVNPDQCSISQVLLKLCLDQLEFA